MCSKTRQRRNGDASRVQVGLKPTSCMWWALLWRLQFFKSCYVVIWMKNSQKIGIPDAVYGSDTRSGAASEARPTRLCSVDLSSRLYAGRKERFPFRASTSKTTAPEPKHGSIADSALVCSSHHTLLPSLTSLGFFEVHDRRKLRPLRPLTLVRS